MTQISITLEDYKYNYSIKLGEDFYQVFFHKSKNKIALYQKEREVAVEFNSEDLFSLQGVISNSFEIFYRRMENNQ